MKDLERAGAGERAGDVAALELMTRALVGLTLHSLEALGGEVSLPQFRLLLIAAGLGRVSSSRIAADAMMTPSSVTRLADKLEAAGLLQRGADPRSRSIVTLEVTRAGLDLVARVVARRHELLGGVLGRMEPGERETAARIARRFAGLAGDAAAFSVTGPLPV
ncbi:MAG: MarR family transcriptional regulator [Nocardiopsaceae bacterium]|nr:MarR family transcriptional regulator [Nocardiopsaceae bacterium]